MTAAGIGFAGVMVSRLFGPRGLVWLEPLPVVFFYLTPVLAGVAAAATSRRLRDSIASGVGLVIGVQAPWVLTLLLGPRPEVAPRPEVETMLFYLFLYMALTAMAHAVAVVLGRAISEARHPPALPS